MANLFREPRAPEIYEYEQINENHGFIRYFGLLGAERVLITNPEYVHQVLQVKSYSTYKWTITKRVFGSILGDGMLLAEGERHKVRFDHRASIVRSTDGDASKKIQRKKLGPAFSSRHIKDLVPIFWSKTVEMASVLQSAAVDPVTNAHRLVDLSTIAARATLDIISLAAFDKCFDTMHDPKGELSLAYRRIVTPGRNRRFRTALAGLLPKTILWALPLQRNDSIRESNTVIKNVCRDSIQRAKTQNAASSGVEAVNILSVALRCENFDDEDLVDQLMTFLIAGHETTANTLSLAVYFLCKNPEVQDRLRSEIREHLPSLKSSEVATSASLDNLAYLQAVCNETLRLMPVVPLLYREASDPLNINGQHIPAGTVMVISPWAVNRSAKYWGPKPEIFDPQRWMEKDAPAPRDSNSKYRFLTFSHGPRSCIGQGFARAEFAALLAGIIGSFECKLQDAKEDIAVTYGLITLRVDNGVKVYLNRIEGW